jgi:hypothetical protein
MADTMDKPSATFTPSPTSTPSQFPLILPDPSMYKQNFDQLLNNRGIRFEHQRALPCPNMRALDDNSHDPLCPHCDGSGILYYQPKEIIGVFTSNSIEKQFEYQGSWETGTAVVTLPTEYADGTQADFTLYDRLVVKDYTVRLWEKKEYEPRTDSKQQLRYPIVKVEELVTATPTVLKNYILGVDFAIEDGKIKWIGTTPDYDTINEIGQAFSVAYLANPEYVVLQPLRELRVSQQLQAGGTKLAIRLPQQVIVKRDFLVNSPEKLASAGA